MFPWGAADIGLFVLLPAILTVSGFFSGSETAFFGLRAHEREDLRERDDAPARAATALLAHPRLLLITILLCNMGANVVYFVASSVLLLRMDPTPIGPAGVAVASLVFLTAIILTGEVAPKLLAARAAQRWVRWAAVPLLAVHRFLTPVRLPMNRFVIEPLLRLASTRTPAATIAREELESLLEVSRDAGVIDDDEFELLEDVIQLSRQKVRDIMTPRVRMAAVPSDATRDDVLRILQETRAARAPVYEGTIDTIVGILDLRRFRLEHPNADGAEASVRDAMTAPAFVPELATLDHLLAHFRDTQAKMAVVADEYGQTVGIVTLDDVALSLFGGPSAAAATEMGATDRQADPCHAPLPLMLIGLGRWRVDGEFNIHEFAEAFDLSLDSGPTPSLRISTLSGLITERLQRVPEPGDEIDVGHLRLKVTAVRDNRAAEIEVEALS